MRRLIAPGLAVAAALTLAGCADNPGDDAAQAACRTYARTASDPATGAAMRTTALERAQRAAEADASYDALQTDMREAWARSDALAAAHNRGRTTSAGEMNAYVAADKRVRADCSDAGADIGRLKP